LKPNKNYLSGEGRPRILAHRGLVSAGVPENTIAAFSAALNAGADYIETDVQVSADGVAVVFHDEDLLRLVDDNRRISDLAIFDLQQVLIGGVHSIPSLEEVLNYFPKARFNLDVKSEAGVVAVAEVINRLAAWDRILISSFSERRRKRTLRRLHSPVATSAGVSKVLAIYALWRIGFGHLIKFITKESISLQVPVGVKFVTLAQPGFINAVHRAGLEVHFWTINDLSLVQELISMGADGIVTDDCDVIINATRRQ
jgi:glycerophosphoryl diester phosphodiesterase